VALPGSISGKTLTFGRGMFPDGIVVSGRAVVTCTKNFRHIPTGTPLYKGPMVRTFEDGIATFSELVPIDHDGLDRHDWTYHVSFQLNGVTEQPESFDFAIFVADPATIDGDALTPVPSPIGVPVSVNALRIPPGGTVGQALVLGSDFGVTWGTFQPVGDYATSAAVGTAVGVEAARATAAEQALATSVANKVNNSTYTAAMANKADLVGGAVPDSELPSRLADSALRAALGSADPVLSAFVYDGSGNLTSYAEDGITITLTYNSDGTVATSQRGTATVKGYSYSGGNLVGVA
jgi:hypothetical protein